MKITEETIPLIEKALGMELYPWQKQWLVNGAQFPDICPCLMYQFEKNIVLSCESRFDGKRCHAMNRRTGKTTAYCISTALSDGPPLDIEHPERFCDYPYNVHYAKAHFSARFLEIRKKLKNSGLTVRKLKLYSNILD